LAAWWLGRNKADNKSATLSAALSTFSRDTDLKYAIKATNRTSANEIRWDDNPEMGLARWTLETQVLFALLVEAMNSKISLQVCSRILQGALGEWQGFIDHLEARI